jgi:hypothetical protein
MGLAILCSVAACTLEPGAPVGIGHVASSADVKDNDNGGGITLTVSPRRLDLLVGQSGKLKYALTNPAGHAVPSNRPISWSSEDPRVAVVDDRGVVTGVGVGKADITASGGGASGFATVVVTCESGPKPKEQADPKGKDPAPKPCCDPKDKNCKEQQEPPPDETKSPPPQD